MASGGQSKRWALRYTGGPMRIIQSETPITEQKAKQVYLSRQCWKGTDQLDPDTAWPTCEHVPDEDIGKYKLLLSVHPVVGKPLALVEV